MKNNAGQEFEILKKYKKQIGKRTWEIWLIQFEDTGTTKEVYACNAKVGKARDPYAISFCGKGCTGEYRKTPYWRQAKRLWSNMLKRCYDENYESGYHGRGYTVCKRWLCFEHFLEDLPKIPNFSEWLDGFDKTKTQFNLDKDLLVEGNKVYCLECCSFVPEGVNKSAGAKNGKPYTKKPRPIKALY